MQIPSEKDWAGYERDIDARYAHKIFFGKSNEQMQSAFRDNVIEKTDEIRFMPTSAFQYYVFGLRDFVIRRQFVDYESSDAANCFLGLVLEKLRKEPHTIVPVIDQLLPDLEYVARNQDLYEADKDIYGDFMETFEEILRLSGNQA